MPSSAILAPWATSEAPERGTMVARPGDQVVAVQAATQPLASSICSKP
jgi:hypothetical protein